MVLQTTLLAKRLAMKMQQATVKQLYQQALEDIQKMDSHLQRAQGHANRTTIERIATHSLVYCTSFVLVFIDGQGGLDLQYLSQRYEKGKEWTSKFMETHHVYESTDVGGLPDLHARLLQFQAKLGDGGDALLGFIGHFVCFAFMIGAYRFLKEINSIKF